MTAGLVLCSFTRRRIRDADISNSEGAPESVSANTWTFVDLTYGQPVGAAKRIYNVLAHRDLGSGKDSHLCPPQITGGREFEWEPGGVWVDIKRTIHVWNTCDAVEEYYESGIL